MGQEEWAGARLGMPLMLCSQVWYRPLKQEHTKGFNGLWGGSGGYMTRFAFYLSCLFRFVFLFLCFTYQIFCYIVRSISLFLVVSVICQI